MISIQQLGDMFDKKNIFKKPINTEAEKMLLNNFDALIYYIENIRWKALAGSDRFEIYPAVGTVVPRIFQLLHVSYQLFKRGYEGMSYSLLRTAMDHQDLIHVFFQDSKWAKLWYSDDNVTKPNEPLSPRKVRELLSKEIEDFFKLFSKYVHPTSRDAHDAFFALVEEDGELRAARLDVELPVKSLHINLGGIHSEGNEWVTIVFINTILIRFLNQLDAYLSEFVNSCAADEPVKVIRRLDHFLRPHLLNELQEISQDLDQNKMTCAGILAGSLGDKITNEILNSNPEKLKRLEEALRIKNS